MNASFSLSRTLVASALLLAAAGCGGTDCSTEPSQCPSIAASALCGGGACQVDGVATACALGACTMGFTQKLSIPLGAAGVTSATPDLRIDVAGGGVILPEDVIVTLDGQTLTVEDGTEANARFRVRWTSSAAPALLEISFAKGTGSASVAASFADVACIQAETVACNGGGA